MYLGFLLSFLALAFALLGKASAAEEAGARIVGGHTTTIEAEPYIVYLLESHKFTCGGSLISKSHVVTAAHCVLNKKASSFEVVAGSTKLYALDGVKHTVRTIFVPEGFSMKTMNMDVAVLKLKQPYTLGNKIQTIELATQLPTVGYMTKVSGWGLTSQNGAVSDTLRSVNVPIVAWAKCKKDYARRIPLTNSMQCAAEPGTKDSCAGDSGGPMVCDGKLCGIVSWGIGCAQRQYPGVYTTIVYAPVVEFINVCLKS